MKPTKLSIIDREDERELRERMAHVRVLVADRDLRTATLVQKVLFAFGMRAIEIATDGEQALEYLKSRPYDFLVTEWNMHPFDGLALVKTIRAAREDKRIRRDIPIIMLTAKAEINSVEAARDAGITEFVVKPFTARALSSRIVQIIDNPRVFVESLDYAGPCRRRHGEPPPGIPERRKPRATTAHISPPDYSLLNNLGVKSTREIIDNHAVDEAHAALMAAGEKFVEWAHEDIENLTMAYKELLIKPQDSKAQLTLQEAAYAIRAQAGMFGYELGSEVGGMLLHYMATHPKPNNNHMRVIAKHIDTIRVVFNQKVERGNHRIAQEVIESLKELVRKLE